MKKSWKNDNLLNLKEKNWRPDHDMYKELAHESLEDFIMRTPQMDSILNVISEAAAFKSDTWKHDGTDQEFYELLRNNFSEAIDEGLSDMFDYVVDAAVKLGLTDEDMIGPMFDVDD